jgi:Putative lumazine-binding
MKKIIIFLLCISVQQLYAQKETAFELINQTLLDYIEGTANGEPNRLKRAFHKDFNLYYVQNDSLKIWNGQDYMGGIKEGQKANRIGRVVSIDYTDNAATAKIEIDIPARKRLYTDYLILLKYEGQWKIIHKSFTFKEYSK